MASRILGMGDVVSLVEKAEEAMVYVDGAQAGSLFGSTYFDASYGWNVRMGNFVGCIDELRISKTVR